MAPAYQAALMAYEQTIHNTRAEMLGAYIDQIRGLSEHEDWALLVRKAKDAGLEKEDLCRELSCAWSTVTRWMAGQTQPGPFARTGIKEKLLGMLSDMKQKELSYARQPELSLGRVPEYA